MTEDLRRFPFLCRRRDLGGPQSGRLWTLSRVPLTNTWRREVLPSSYLNDTKFGGSDTIKHCLLCVCRWTLSVPHRYVSLRTNAPVFLSLYLQTTSQRTLPLHSQVVISLPAYLKPDQSPRYRVSSRRAPSVPAHLHSRVGPTQAQGRGPLLTNEECADILLNTLTYRGSDRIVSRVIYKRTINSV